MFENDKQANEPEDIFANVDQPPVPPSTPAATPGPAMPPPPPAPGPTIGSTGEPTPTPPGFEPPRRQYGTTTKVLSIIAASVLILAALGFIGWYIYRTYIAVPREIIEQFQNTNEEDLQELEDLFNNLNRQIDNLNANTSANANTLGGQNTNANTNTSQPPVVETDTDGDGLSDAEERRHRTSITNHDTDGDGLSDYEEVHIYQTNPLNPDTDGDGFSDGEEVQNNYDPKGPGRLTDFDDAMTQ